MWSNVQFLSIWSSDLPVNLCVQLKMSTLGHSDTWIPASETRRQALGSCHVAPGSGVWSRGAGLWTPATETWLRALESGHRDVAPGSGVTESKQGLMFSFCILLPLHIVSLYNTVDVWLFWFSCILWRSRVVQHLSQRVVCFWECLRNEGCRTPLALCTVECFSKTNHHRNKLTD